MTLIDIARPAPDVAILTLDRPERLNALSFALVEELHDALAAFERDNSCRVVILTGAGRG
ncbi:enoyl-CoA hydratase/isomerase family protein, partial [Rhodococcus hoagii]|nr:enoyl-CoA hydratase/isomerase family protein [Prescottella equi]